MGRAPRTHYDYQLWDREQAGSIQISRCDEYRAVDVRGASWIHIHPLDAKVILRPSAFSFEKDLMASRFDCHYLSRVISFRIRQPSACRLYHIHSGQILQATPRHAPARHSLQEEVSVLQIRCRCACDSWSCHIYAAPVERI